MVDCSSFRKATTSLLLFCALSLCLLSILPSPGPILAHALYDRVEIPGEHKNSSMFMNSKTASAWSKANAWELPIMKGIMKGQMLHLRKIEDHPNKWHTCYEVVCQNTWNHHCPAEGTPEATIDFCYPAVVITGMPKCGTSATYDLLSRYTGAILMFEKENCPYTRRRSHWEFFHTLPRARDVTPGKLLIDGCIDTQKNLMLRRLLHEPETLYIVMTRNYADMVWSSYNFWCKREYDGFDCDNTRWVQKHYNRSASLFHAMVAKDRGGYLGKAESPLHAELARPCANAGGFYREYLEMKVWQDVGGQYITRQTTPNHTLVMASEELERNPLWVWERVAHYFGLHNGSSSSSSSSSSSAGSSVVTAAPPPPPHAYSFSLGNFSLMRTNTQEHKGAGVTIPVSSYRPGVFSISNYEPMRNDTRDVLDECWREDCVWVRELTGYPYHCRGAGTAAAVAGR